MNRNDFLKKLGFGALAVAIAPKVLITEKSTTTDFSKTDWTIVEARCGNSFYLANGNCYFKTADPLQRDDVISFGDNDRYVVARENDGWYFLEKI